MGKGFVSTFWSASDTDFKNLSSNFGWCPTLDRGLSLPFDQQVTLTLKTVVPTLDGGCLCLLISKWNWLKNISSNFGKGIVSTFWSASDTDFKNLSSNFGWGEGCLCLLISKWHWLWKPKFQLWTGGLSPPFDQQVTLTPKTVSSNFEWWGVVSAFDQQVTLTLKCKFQLWMGEGVVSAFWSASDTDFKNLSSNFGWGRGCLCLLISKCHWLQKPKFQLWTRGLSLSFDQQGTLTSKT